MNLNFEPKVLYSRWYNGNVGYHTLTHTQNFPFVGKAYLPKPYGNENTRSTFDCCGSKLPDYYTIPTSPFERVLSGQSFVSMPAEKGGKKDQLPPARITDLRLKSYIDHTLQATLTWTSPGLHFSTIY